MNQDELRLHPHLFVVRVWAEDLGRGQVEWRGKVQHLTSGETRYFRDWAALMNFLQGVLPEVRSIPGEEEQEADRTQL